MGRRIASGEYRPDIDGLRAIAVLLVFFFHATPGYLPNGFVGVDIFFVISGYLITKIILTETNEKRFRFSHFYSRRIRRIFPALILVLTAVSLFGWATLVPGEFRQLGRHIFGAAAFYLNFQLIKDVNYFDSVAITKPLLHLWSLSVEEQFYVMWPLLIYLSSRYNVARWSLLCVAVVSALLNLYFSYAGSVFMFYFSPARFWELSIGASVNYIEPLLFRRSSDHHPAGGNEAGPLPEHPEIPISTLVTQAISIAGTALIVIGTLLVGYQNYVYPSYLTLLPTVGTAFLILSRGAFVNRVVLANSALVGIGLISFPLYLWHWPILAFQRILYPAITLDMRTIAVVLAATLVLAAGTYEIVEKPFRQARGGGRRLKLTGLLVCFASLGATGIVISAGIWPSRFGNSELAKYLSFTDYPAPDRQTIDRVYGFGQIGDNSTSRILLLGDSHAQQYRLTLNSLSAANREKPDFPAFLFGLRYDRLSDLLEIANSIRADQSIKAVILAEFWAIQYGSDKIDYSVRCCGSSGGSVGGPSHHDALPEDERRKLDKELIDTIEALKSSGKKVFIVLDNPFGREFDPKELVKRDLFSGLSLSANAVPRAEAVERTEPIRSRIERIGRAYGAVIIDPFEGLCDSLFCRSNFDDGSFKYKDYDHLSVETVREHADYFAAVLE